MRKGSNSIADPINPEQLRHRIGLLGTGLMMIAFRHTDRTALQGITPQLMQRYLAYLLGEYCWQLVGKDADGRTITTPAWNQLIAYEWQIRRKA